MAKVEQRPTIEIEVVLRLNEVEVRALNALVSYGDESIMNVFGTHIRRHLQDVHADGFKSLFSALRQVLPGILRRTDKARMTFMDDDVNAPRISIPTMDPQPEQVDVDAPPISQSVDQIIAEPWETAPVDEQTPVEEPVPVPSPIRAKARGRWAD